MFRFTIRDVLWLTLVLALGLGWFVHQRNYVGLRDELHAAVEWRERVELACERHGFCLWDQGRRRGITFINLREGVEAEKSPVP